MLLHARRGDLQAGSLPVAVVDTIGAGIVLTPASYMDIFQENHRGMPEIGCICGSLSTRKSGRERLSPGLMKWKTIVQINHLI